MDAGVVWNCMRTAVRFGTWKGKGDGVGFGVENWAGRSGNQGHCASVRVVKLVICEVGNGGSAPITGQALLLIHIIWLVLLGFVGLFGLL
ncbi:hypothetical protein KY290_028096 [Solanum tuberosum]|uniref:Uncharacterized protein n=1 Tax=Solanum tuberosum TaxID=4113 RepID=A0ABQ7UHD6_SOLTU|nr:hypothetical protein KY290_028096 [Solanum tuberosum]